MSSKSNLWKNGPPYGNDLFSVYQTPEMYVVNHGELVLEVTI